MTEYSTSIAINGSAQEAWDLLVNVAEWQTWNSTVERVEGRALLGDKVTVHTKSAPGKAFAVKVAEFEPPRSMVWMGGLPLGLCTGKRTYTLESGEGSSVQFTMRETFTGPLSGMIARQLPDSMQEDFDEFALCLKRAVEGSESDG